MNTYARGTLLLLCLLFLCSCIDFGGQTVTYRYDDRGDRLLMFLVYEHLHCTDAVSKRGQADGEKSPGPSPTEKQQLDAVIKGQRAFLFMNWILEYNRAELTKSSVGLAESIAEAAPEDREKLLAAKAALDAVLESIEVHNGPPFLNAAGHLCGYQYVIIKDVSKLLPLLNRALRLNVEISEELQGEARRRAEAFVQDSVPVELRQNRIRIRFPSDYDSFLKLRRDLLGAEHVFDFLNNEMALNYDEPVVEIIVGRLEALRVTLTKPLGESKPDQGLIETVRETHGLAPTPDLDKLREVFLTTGKRPDQ